MTVTKRVRIFQICYNQETRRQVEPQFIALDNSSSPRGDWAEFWPIRETLQRETFDKDELVGFFSPRFREKTNMDGTAVLQALHSYDAEVYSFSPYFEQCALYDNPVHQGESHHPGLLAVVHSLASRLGLRVDPRTLISDQTTTIFCNYFVAKPYVWKRWLELAEQLFAISENPADALAARLGSSTVHREAETYAMKVFVLERLISLLLESEGWTAQPCVDIKSAPRSLLCVDAVMAHLVVCDALKGQYKRTHSPVHLELFRQIRQDLLAELQQLQEQAAEQRARSTAV